MSAIGEGELPKRAILPKTSWGLIEAARQGPDGEEARREVLRRYYRPVCAYTAAILRNSSNGTGLAEDPEEIAHEFFAAVFEKVVEKADSSRRFRPYLKQALRHFLIDRHRKAARRPRMEPVDGKQGGRDALIAPEVRAAGDAFLTEWVRSLLRKVLARVQEAAEEGSQRVHFEIFVAHYLSDAERPPRWGELGKRYGLDEKQARNRSEIIKGHFQRILREVLVEETGSTEAAEQELATLQALLRG